MNLHWTRRQFVSHTAATALIASRYPALLAGENQKPQSAATSPEEITGKIRGLFEGKTERPLRYHPDRGGLTIRNGREYFNRPLYGPNIAFRVDAGDLPEFSLYLPGHGGNLRLGFQTGTTAKWLAQADEVVATYHAGRMTYVVHDAALGTTQISVEVMTAGHGAGLHVRAQAAPAVAGLQLLYAFAGASGRKGKRGGDIGCESQPVSQFFQVRSEECAGNVYKLDGHHATLTSTVSTLSFEFPAAAHLSVADARLWEQGWASLARSSGVNPALPALLASVPLAGEALHLRINGQQGTAPEAAHQLRCTELDNLAARFQLQTPDPFVDALAPALCIAADALWDEAQQCVMHGAVAWRNPLAGWRGPYVLDALGLHDRFRAHARHWIARQNVMPVTSANPATGKPDPGSHLSRTENLLHSNGDLSHNHYDMNLVFFDALLRHLKWTGDLQFAAEIWPALERHLAWEQRLFRRLYNGLPLYEAYACIWASDNLQYNGGGATHSTAYNLFANRMAAQVARLIGKDAGPYGTEAALIEKALQQLLWLREQGTYGESKDLLGPQTVYASPALWSVYHAIDSGAADRKQAWQMCVERLAGIRSVPVGGASVPSGGTMLSCSDWLPYEWSLNLLLLAENMHMALALWQAGLVDEAYSLFKGNLLDSMFQGLCPGNFHMTSQLDAHRQEAQRDFGDPIGMTSRALVEGLFGIQPDLMQGRLQIAPGFPNSWKNAALHHQDFDFKWIQNGDTETCEITSRFGKPLSLALTLRAARTGQPVVRVNDVVATGAFVSGSVGAPALLVQTPPSTHWVVSIEWQGDPTPAKPAHRIVHRNDLLFAGLNVVDDPQGALANGRATLPGKHTVFTQEGPAARPWWMPHSFLVLDAPKPVRPGSQAAGTPLDLTAQLTGSVAEIFRRAYDSPRSPYCSLAIPQQGIGAWAAFDRQPEIDDSGLRALGGRLQIPGGPLFNTAAGSGPNCLFLSHWQQDQPRFAMPLSGSAARLALMMAGSTFPQCSRMDHAVITVIYSDGTSTALALRNPENWWPIEQDYLIDDYMFIDAAPPPIRVDLKSAKVRQLTQAESKGQGRTISGGSANVLFVELDPVKTLSRLEIKVNLYGIVIALMAVTQIPAE